MLTTEQVKKAIGRIRQAVKANLGKKDNFVHVARVHFNTLPATEEKRAKTGKLMKKAQPARPDFSSGVYKFKHHLVEKKFEVQLTKKTLPVSIEG